MLGVFTSSYFLDKTAQCEIIQVTASLDEKKAFAYRVLLSLT